MRHKFVPSVFGLESRMVLSTLRLRPAAIRRAQTGNGNGLVVGQLQNALNFTSHTYFQMVESRGAGADGLDRLFRFYDEPEDIDSLINGLAKLSRRAPFGGSDLLPIWLESLAAGGGEDQLRRDLATYINSGVGVSWNVLQSRHSHSTDSDLVFNGKVKNA